MASDPKKPYGDVTYADPGYQKDGKKRYPIDTEAHCRAAWSYINQAGNASAYSSEQVASIKSKIRSALKRFGVETSDSAKRSLEFRSVDLSTWAVDEVHGSPVFHGRVMTYGVRSELPVMVPGGRMAYETVDPGAATATLAEDDQVFLIEHNPSQVVSRRSAGSLRFTDGASALDAESDLDDDRTYVRDFKHNLRMKLLGGMSFGFLPRGRPHFEVADGGLLHRVRDMFMPEVTATIMPAYGGTSAGMRSVYLSRYLQDEWVDPDELDAYARELEAPVTTGRQDALHMRYLASRYNLSFTAEGE